MKCTAPALLFCPALFAQNTPALVTQHSSLSTDTTHLLQTIEITATPIRNKTTGERSETWQSADLQNHTSNHLGDVLSMQSGVYVKSYGLGSSATTSMRGGSAGHTQVIWNGLPVQNPMLGQLDFSLIPIGFVDKMSVAYGGNTATWGSGAIGGTVFLENKPIDHEGFSIKMSNEVGSFGWWDQQVKLHYKKGKVNQVIRYFHQQSENDFSYSISPVLPKRKQTNAAIKQDGVLHESYWNIQPNQQLSSQIWLQKTEREIPPRTTQNRSEANQSDRFLRTAINWKRTGGKGMLSARGGLFREEQDYTEPLAGVASENDFWKAIGEVEQAWHFSQKQKLQVGLNHTWLQSAAGAYRQSRQQNRTSAFAMFRQQWGLWETQLNFRQELIDFSFAPIVPSLGLEGKLAKWFSLKTKVSRNYRLPTLNDLYWQPGGNADLLPERGWSEEVGIEYQLPLRDRTASPSDQPQKSRLGVLLIYSGTAFNRNISDWIQWAIVDGQQFYSPHNITKVWSRGIEQRFAVKFIFHKIEISLAGGYDFIQSTYQQAVEKPKFEKGEQLAYTPEHQWFGQFSVKWKGFSMAYLHRYNGKVNTLNFTELKGYHLGQFHLNYDWKMKPSNSRLFFRMENVWNASYEVIEYRAMPGRYFRAGLELSFSKRK